MPATGLMLGIEYNTDLFRDDRIARMGGHFVQLVDSILADPAVPVGRLNVLPEPERRQLIEAFNQTAAAYPRDLQRGRPAGAGRPRRTPDAVAVVCGDRRLSYRESCTSGPISWRGIFMAWRRRRTRRDSGGLAGALARSW